MHNEWRFNSWNVSVKEIYWKLFKYIYFFINYLYYIKLFCIKLCYIYIQIQLVFRFLVWFYEILWFDFGNFQWSQKARSYKQIRWYNFIIIVIGLIILINYLFTNHKLGQFFNVLFSSWVELINIYFILFHKDS